MGHRSTLNSQPIELAVELFKRGRHFVKVDLTFAKNIVNFRHLQLKSSHDFLAFIGRGGGKSSMNFWEFHSLSYNILFGLAS